MLVHLNQAQPIVELKAEIRSCAVHVVEDTELHAFPPLRRCYKVLMKKYLCLGCGFSYDEARGLPEHGVAPGTRWADIPDDWVCPDCGTPKSGFEMVEIPYYDDARPA